VVTTLFRKQWQRYGPRRSRVIDVLNGDIGGDSVDGGDGDDVSLAMTETTI
jgi:hypothetical protein